MREIKFRAWDTETGEWLTMEFGIGNLIDTAIAFESIELMQYTGRKDKKGQEVYRGDVVEISFTGGQTFSLRHVIEWQDDKARWVGRRLGATFRALEGLGDMLLDSHGEVIGNIYENPELICVTQ